MTIRHAMDGGELSLEIDIDQGARISSINFRGFECAVPFRGQLLTWGWYPMLPWAGRIRNGEITSSSGQTFQLPTNLTPPHAIHGFGLTSPWQEIGTGAFAIDFPAPFNGARAEQRFEILDNALRWSIEYEAGDCDLPFSLGFHPWFPRELHRGASAEIDFVAEKMFERGSDYLPTGKLITPTPPPWMMPLPKCVVFPEFFGRMLYRLKSSPTLRIGWCMTKIPKVCVSSPKPHHLMLQI